MNPLWFIPVAFIWSSIGTYIWWRKEWKSSVTENLYLLAFAIVSMIGAMYMGSLDIWT